MKVMEIYSNTNRKGWGARKTLVLLLALFFTFHLPLLTSCVKEETFDDTPTGNFEALWRIIDEHYCFFEYKKNEYGLDWNEV